MTKQSESSDGLSAICWGVLMRDGDEYQLIAIAETEEEAKDWIADGEAAKKGFDPDMLVVREVSAMHH